jgi:hypothetical protein
MSLDPNDYDMLRISFENVCLWLRILCFIQLKYNDVADLSDVETVKRMKQLRE